ncbi:MULTISPECIES: cob(I)yrinic acid a,c-diamide adenosyltransferase [Thauera]|jgi:cob(I)alamin adenosyltransferase|uniref:Corrinoid adenosyltransferase n=2 Tax=Thauera aminoaromatica TaxID=164330 RepID=C4KCF3_THASP|nr:MULTISPECIES: cob(I)yrinic acid a,c-diamide adenosyltransferase [Thauera]OPZ03765.1 MAG: Cob(I)yrinic acid a,c-diamide adenosyltransferase [Alphaproteobacteria bacterium ADurb.BinA305]ACR02344.1 cob(I)alamin adenosyltransferase [Thauera aminoaromatica]ENO85677.1 cob(I)alamin adenolsyltransferase/cobinamide ATP-dependent adenolsyltransferase [Thauera aminoaromatica S2]KIN89697.1 cob(I)yrinic acid a,c-diamide adenosyltransferase [Thauera sp. SWB20]TXH84767.1 MAG: cob(I)yrinic acid a,c-diamide
MTQTPDRDTRHNARMARKKDVVDEKIAAAQAERGVLLVNTGNGKGKSSAGFGLVARALGHGMQVGVVQFIKGRSDTGEEAFFRTQPGVRWHVMGEGFTWETQDRARDVASAEAAWALAREMLQNPEVGLVVLDELNIALKYQYLDVERVLADLRARPPMQHVVVTGRGAPPALVEAADTVTDMTPVKHAFAAGVKAMPGMEW